MDFIDQKHWDNAYETCEFEAAPIDDLLRRWVERLVLRGKGRCLEIGCFPGTYLAVFGELGYELHGIDLTPRVEDELPNWLRSRGYRVGEFRRSDFLSCNVGQKYEIVCSFGFIEHFADWPDVLIKQASLVRKGGYLVVSTPNFSGFIQRLLHFTLDRENYDRHNVYSMNPVSWKKIIRCMDFDILYSGYFGSFGFWNEEQRRGRLQNELLYLVYRLMPHLQKILPCDMKSYSPFCGLIAKKR